MAFKDGIKKMTFWANSLGPVTKELVTLHELMKRIVICQQEVSRGLVAIGNACIMMEDPHW